MSTKATAAFLGATGGCVNTALVQALKNGHRCYALARTPAKLITMLLDDGVSQSAIDTHLTIIQGDVRSTDDLKRVFGTMPVDVIVSGVGAYLGKDYDSTICRDTASTTIKALDELRSTLRKKPAICMISTIGVTKTGARDVPLMYLPLYHTLLNAPRLDKQAMEQEIIKALDDPRGAPFSGYTFVRPTLLASSEPKGTDAIRVGSDDSPELGYSISRKDVGLWIYEELVKGDASRWAGAGVTITN